MAKSSREKIAEDENKIVNELRMHAKESIDKIAKSCSCSRQKVWRIIKGLEKNKTIWGYSAVLDDEKLGLKRYFIFLKRTNKPVSKEIIEVITTRRLKQETKHIDVTLEESYYVHGFSDWVLCITANDFSHVTKYCEVLKQLFVEGIVSEMKILEVLFTNEKCCISNPEPEKIIKFFL
ncbi:MAG: Lrp/AsnC family transcriptional regulator [Thermoplasmatales archaeon]|nr:MAG: Lrp/AsnC family transcriptional regulator [Thermoplasmatales archaeon]